MCEEFSFLEVPKTGLYTSLILLVKLACQSNYLQNQEHEMSIIQ